MIDPKELRLGNYYIDEEGDERIVDLIQRDSVTGKKHLYRGYFSLHNSLVALIQPISLTEEWLIKFGFQQGVLGSWTKSITIFGNLRELSFSGDYLYLREGKEVFGSGEDDLCVLWNKDVMKQFYVHSLQNLFFALKNEELTIKE